MGRENMIKYVCIFSAEISRLINYILLTSFYCRKVMVKDQGTKEDISSWNKPVFLRPCSGRNVRRSEVRKVRYSITIDLFKADLIIFCNSNIWTEQFASYREIHNSLRIPSYSSVSPVVHNPCLFVFPKLISPIWLHITIPICLLQGACLSPSVLDDQNDPAFNSVSIW